MTEATPQTAAPDSAPLASGNRATINISRRILDWYDHHGRKDLPWQQNITPYRVWVSEIMLQQTQVATVIPYFLRFIDAFPDVGALAAATEDQVLHHWTGLGYYSRARNLHKAAQRVTDELAGQFPPEVDALCTLPGVGRSTAGAIRAIAFGARAAILDGNVKRVLARFHAVPGWPGQGAVHQRLWDYAEAHLPEARYRDYTQAMMDLGATLCTRSKPACTRCPLVTDCAAFACARQLDFPARKPPKSLPIKATAMLIMGNPKGEVLLVKQPPTGIWGGLWVFPQLADLQQLQTYMEDRFGPCQYDCETGEPFRHTFSHYHLDITPVKLSLNVPAGHTMENDRQLWYNPSKPVAIGLAAPVKKLLAQLSR